MKTDRKFWLVVFILVLLAFIIAVFCYFYQIKKSSEEAQISTPEPYNSLDNLEGKDLLDEEAQISTPESYNSLDNLEGKDLLDEDAKAKLGLYHRAVFEKIPREGDDTRVDIKFLGIQEPKPLPFQELSIDDKDRLHLKRDDRFQVLLTDSEGKILQYRIMKNENDIVTEY
jgi:hypothetical protein